MEKKALTLHAPSSQDVIMAHEQRARLPPASSGSLESDPSKWPHGVCWDQTQDNTFVNFERVCKTLAQKDKCNTSLSALFHTTSDTSDLMGLVLTGKCHKKQVLSYHSSCGFRLCACNNPGSCCMPWGLPVRAILAITLQSAKHCLAVWA